MDPMAVEVFGQNIGDAEVRLAIGAGILAFVVMTVWSLLSGKAKAFVWLLVAIIIVLAAAGIGVSFNRD